MSNLTETENNLIEIACPSMHLQILLFSPKLQALEMFSGFRTQNHRMN